MEDFFLTLYFYNELAAGPVVGLVVGSITNHVLSFGKVRARLRAPKCHPAWDKVREPLRKVTLRTGVWGTLSLYPQSVRFSVGSLSAWEKLVGSIGGIHYSPGDGAISRIFHQGWVPVYSSSQFLWLCHLLTGVGTTDLGGIYVWQGQKSSADSWVPCLPWREPIETMPHHWVGKRCTFSSRCSTKLGRPSSTGSDHFVKPMPRVPPLQRAGMPSVVDIMPGWLFAAGQLGATSIYLHIQARLHSIAHLPCRFDCGHLLGGSHWNSCSHSESQEAPHLCMCRCHS